MAVPLHIPEVIVPTVVKELDPANGEAPIELYEIVFAADPSKLAPGVSPVPVAFIVNALAAADAIVIFAEPSNATPLIVTGVAILEAVAALPVIFPVTFDPLTVTIFASVTFASFIFVVVTASVAIVGSAAVPAKSPANWIFPFELALASGIVAPAISVST